MGFYLAALVKSSGIYFFKMFIFPLFPVTGGKSAGVVHNIHQHRRAHGFIGLYARVFSCALSQGFRKIFQQIDVGKRLFPVSPKGNGLDVF